MVEIWEASCEVEVDGASESAGWLPGEAAAPPPQRVRVRLQISQTADGFCLYSEPDNPIVRGGDTLHASVAEAMAQGEFEFGVSKDGWVRVAA